VSQQIKLLEDGLGTTLFDRSGRSVRLTEQGALFSHYVEAGFDEFLAGVKRVAKVAQRDRINLNVSPYFATRYLLDSLGEFRKNVPGVDLRLTTMVETPNFSADEVDVSIQWGYGHWKDFHQTLLVRDPKIICCSPSLARLIRTAADLRDATLLHPVLSSSLWSDVFGHLGVGPPESTETIRFDDAATMRRATIAGMGVGLLSVFDAVEDIRAGALVAPLGLHALRAIAPEKIPGFYLILPRSRRRMKNIAAFCEWIVGENWSGLLPSLDDAS
jgi:LysR family glycine cleavage system transcriptional activator